MTIATTTLTDFLLERIAEDEARIFDPPPLMVQLLDGAVTVGTPLRPEYVGELLSPMHAHRALAECKAKRQLIDHAYDYGATVDSKWGCRHSVEALRGAPEFDPVPQGCAGMMAVGSMLRTLALSYADHPDYQEAWRA